MNPFSSLYAKCNTGAGADKHAELAEGPDIIDIEPVGLCNFRCTMCPTGLNALGRPGGFMEPATFAKIVSQAFDYNTALRFIGWGEPTLHPRLPQFIRVAHNCDILTHLNTNGSKITPELASDLVDAGLGSIKFSFQGTDRETYQMMRRIDFFEEMIQAIDIMKQARDGRSQPFIAASTTTTGETPEMVEAFRQRLEPLVDQLTIGKTIFEYIDLDQVPAKQRERLTKAAELSTVVKRHPDPCPEIYNKLSIHWDGTAVVCCNAYTGNADLGNINDTPLAELWRHPLMETYRTAVAKGDYSLPNCRDCWDYMELTEGTAGDDDNTEKRSITDDRALSC